MGVFDVKAGALIKAVAADLKKQGLEMPEWALFVKTGVHKKRSPDSPEWFFERMASVLYRIYKQGPLGTESLRSYYGGKKRRGVRKAHFRKASGKVLRVCLQMLEKNGLVKKSKKGRVITGKGQSYLLKKAKQAGTLAKEIEKKPEVVEEKSAEEKKVEAELKKREQKEREKEREKEEEKKREKKREEKKKGEKEKEAE